MALFLRLSLGVLLPVIWLCLAPAGRASTNAVPATRSEYELKAAFLYKFAMFVEWPAQAFANTNTPLLIGILGRDPFGTQLETVLAGKRTHGRALEFRRFAKVEDVLRAQCQLLFIASSEKNRLPAILGAIKQAPVLTVGDSPGYGEEGVMINLVARDQSLRFEINLPAAGQAALKISSQLLDLAITVRGESTPAPP